MAVLSAADLKALKWYAEEHGLKFVLSAPPQMRFRDVNGTERTVDMSNIASEYEIHKNEERRERARKRNRK